MSPARLLSDPGMLQTIIDSIPAPIFFKDPSGVYRGCNRAFEAYLGRPRAQIIGQTVFGVAPGDLAEVYHRADLDLIERGGVQVYEAQVRHADGSLHEVVFHKAVIAGSDEQESHGLVGVILDVTDLKRTRAALTQSEARYRAFIANSTEGIFRTELKGGVACALSLSRQVEQIISHARIAECNEAFARLYGYAAPAAMLGRASREFYDADSLRELVVKFVSSGYRINDVETRQFDREGREVWMATSLVGEVEEGRLLRIWGTRRDITERKQQHAALDFMANHDSLTGLANRYWLRRRLDELVEVRAARGEGLALLLLDLDRFKDINDALGHHVGDQLLRLLGDRLARAFRGQGCDLARLGGDEFALLIRHRETAETPRQIAETLLAEVRAPFQIEGLGVEISGSIGISLFPEHARDSSGLLRCADVAMYAAKQEVRRYRLYDRSCDRQSPERLAMLLELGAAIRSGQLTLYYQPKIALADGRLTGFEALLRWQHPVRGLILPGEFVPYAELGELIVPLTLEALDQALRCLRAWADEGLRTRVAVNISPRILLDEGFPDNVQMLLYEHGVDPACLEFELTESAFIHDPLRAEQAFRRLKEMGLTLSIDDFGTGYSSLSLLRRLPLDALKIDMSFVQLMCLQESGRSIVRSIIGLAHNLGLRVVAEGIENAPTVAALKELACDEGQGFHIGRPLPAGQVRAWLRPGSGAAESGAGS